MDVSDINLIKTIIQTGSLSEACRQLGMSQPTLSRKLSRLEDVLGTKLFDRSSTGLVPTKIAEYIVQSATPLQRHLNAIERYVELSTQLQTGSINVGIGPIIEQLLIPEALARFIETTGDVDISIVTETDAALMQMFENSELDVIIGPFDQAAWKTKGVLTYPMISDDIVAVARTDHPIFRSDEPIENTLKTYPLVAPKTRGTVKQTKGAPTLPSPKVSSDNYDLLRRLTMRLDAFCGGPRTIFKKHIANGDLKEIDIDLGMFWQSYLLVRPEILSAPLVSHFVEICEEVSRGKKADLL